MLFWIIAFTLLGSIGAILGAALLLLLSQGVRSVLLPLLVSYATGTLLGSAFFGLIPTGLQHLAAGPFMATVLAGIVAFFILEKAIRLQPAAAGQTETRTSGKLILIGDAFHNFVDGAVIAAAFMTSFPLGMAVSLAVIAHEIPQEIGEFAILLDDGFSRIRALVLNSLSAMAALPGAIAAYLWLGQTQQIVAYMLAISAASFLYIALAGLIPSLHRQTSATAAVQQLLLIVAGIATIAIIRIVSH